MSLLDRLKSFVANPPLDEDGEPTAPKLLPGATDEAIAALEAWLRTPLSVECRELLKQCGGFDDGGDPLDFAGAPYGFDLIPGLSGARIRQIAADGFGDSWFYWNSATGPNLGPIFFHQHEIPVVVYQSPTLEAFLEEWLKLITPNTPNAIDDVHEFRIKPIRTLNQRLLPCAAAISTGDAVLSSFAKAQRADTWICDLRTAKTGDGVNLSEHDIVGVHESQPILALARGRSGFARFLLGRRKVPAV